LQRPSAEDVDWVRQRLDRESRRFGIAFSAAAPSRLALAWPEG
jgi:hypothetical protein